MEENGMINGKNSAALSVKCSETVRGYEVKRLPLGEYLRVMEALREAPGTVMKVCFPEMDAMQMLGKLTSMDAQGLTEVMLRALDVVPDEAIKLLSLLTGIPADALYADPAIGLDGAAEMLEAFWRLNGIENFIRAAGRMGARLREIRAKTGCKG